MISPRCVIIALCASIFIPTAPAAPAVPIQLDPARTSDLKMAEPEPGTYDLRTTGGDPWVVSRRIETDSDPEKIFILSFEYFCPEGIEDFSIYFGPPISGARHVSGVQLPKAETWVETSVNLAVKSAGRWKGDIRLIRLDPGTRKGVRFQVRNLQLREPNESERRGAAQVAADRRAKDDRAKLVREYLATDFPATVRDVVVTESEIRIAGELPPDSSGLSLAEIALEEEPWASPSFTRLTPIPSTDGTEFSVTVPRTVNDRDRLLSRWAVVQPADADRFALASHAVYPTDVTALAPADLPLPKTTSKKGVGGVEFRPIIDELVELGVQHITINVGINELISLKPIDGAESITVDGQTYFIQPGALKKYDQTIGFASDHGMIVSAIILMGFPPDSALRSALIHPESQTAGAYGMPNLTTPAGVRIYRAALEFLARRYDGGDHGLISNWILHNEVDYAWVWSNMGEQPMELFMDTHVRSMRMAYLLARQFNPHARVFLSLTHSWNKAGPEGRSYPPRAMVDLLAEYSATEGDFEWGLAYHPYPVSLFKADTWNDSDEIASFSFDTPMITPKNIEVLDAYLHQPRMLYQGDKVRSVQLSEQGYHTDGYSEDAQKLQAAAFVYTWHKIRPLPSIEAFQTHRWIDHPNEGGLLLGFRTIPDKEHKFGEKKFSWEIFKSLDTPEEARATEFAKEIIGIEDFDEIPYRGKIKGAE